jgi:hypothetical protein
MQKYNIKNASLVGVEFLTMAVFKTAVILGYNASNLLKGQPALYTREHNFFLRQVSSSRDLEASGSVDG